MIIYNDHQARVDDTVLYRCDICGKTANYLSDSWSEIRFAHPTTTPPVHHCLECRSDKREYRP
jgi:hypothetical protein